MRALASDLQALRRSAAAFGLAVVSTLAGLPAAEAATRVHALVVANNRAFAPGATPSSTSELPPLRYADDDAAAFYELVSPIAHSAELLTVMDAETQGLYPGLASSAQVPTLSGVQGAVRRLASRLREQRALGHRNVVFVFFSGHGAVDYGGKPALALLDGGLSHEFLYREILEKLPAEEVHLLIDACHAEAVVRPRDGEAEVVEVSAAQANAFLVQSTLARFPQVGAIVAATTDAKAHEWDEIRHGVFTHELLSALRGAADVNRDRRIEYSEVYAFMAAANREVRDPRARLSIIAKPPDTNRRAALLDLSAFPSTRFAWLSRVPGQHGIIEVGDARGRRLATLHGDREFLADLLIPAQALLYVHGAGKEASFSARAGEIVDFQRLAFSERGSRERGALDDAVRRGLFAAEYGRRYYDGVVDQTPGLIAVEFRGLDEASTPQYWNASLALPPSDSYRVVLGGGLSTGIADVLSVTHGLTLGLRPALGHGAAASLEGFRAGDGPLTEWRIDASLGWLWSTESAPLRLWWGGLLGGGLLSQAVDGLPDRRSAVLKATPVLGFGANTSGRFGIWSELQVSTLFYRRDDATAVSFLPAAWLGGSLRL